MDNDLRLYEPLLKKNVIFSREIIIAGYSNRSVLNDKR
jgi:hypothetical protein